MIEMRCNVPTPEGPTPAAYSVSLHAHERMASRNLRRDAVAVALEFGREVYTRGARIFAIGRKEIRAARERGLDISKFEGVQVVCTVLGEVITAYRNRNLAGLRRS